MDGKTYKLKKNQILEGLCTHEGNLDLLVVILKIDFWLKFTLYYRPFFLHFSEFLMVPIF